MISDHLVCARDGHGKLVRNTLARPICHRDVTTNSKALWPRVREGEVGCLFDEIAYLVEPTERLHMDVQAGPQRGTMPKRCGRARAPDSPVPGEHKDVR